MTRPPQKRKGLTRRDWIFLTSKRMGQLNTFEAAAAWNHLSGALESMGEFQKLATPKFNDIVKAIRRATIFGRHKNRML